MKKYINKFLLTLVLFLTVIIFVGCGTSSEYFTKFIQDVDDWISEANEYRFVIEYNKIYYSSDSNERTEEITINESVIDNDNMYYENKILVGGVTEFHSIMKAYDDNFLLHIIEEENNTYNISSEYLCKTTDFKQHDIVFSNGFTDKMQYQKLGKNHYQVTTSNDEIITILNLFDLDNVEFSNSLVRINTIFDPENNIFEFIYETEETIVEKDGVNMIAKRIVVCHIDQYNDTNKVDIDKFNFLPPNSLKAITKFTDITKPIIAYGGPSFDFYKVQFETGHYTITGLSSNFITITDINKSPIDINNMRDTESDLSTSKSFYIKEGLYYIMVNNVSEYNEKGYYISFNKLD